MFVSALFTTILVFNVYCNAKIVLMPITLPSNTTEPDTNYTNVANSTNNKPINTACSNLSIALEGEMIIRATEVNTLTFDWKHMLKASGKNYAKFDWKQSNCSANATLLLTIPDQNTTTDIVIKEIPFNDLNKSLTVKNKNLSECWGGSQFFIQLYLSNSVVITSNKTVYKPHFLNSSENSEKSPCKVTMNGHDHDHDLIQVNVSKGIDKVLLHCLKSVELNEIEDSTSKVRGDWSYKMIMENEDSDLLIVDPPSDTTRIRLQYFHDVNHTKVISGLVKEFEVTSLPRCRRVELIKSSGHGFFIVLGVVMLLALLVLIGRIYMVRKIRNRASASVDQGASVDTEKKNYLCF